MKKSRILTLVSMLMCIGIVLTSCGNNAGGDAWNHYALNLPGSIKTVDYGSREYWEKNQSYVFEKPSGSIVDKTMTPEIAKSFETEDPRKIIDKSKVSICYGIKNNVYGYHSNTDIRGYKLLDNATISNEGETSKQVLIKKETAPAIYTNVLFATAVINTQESFNEYCWAYDHDVAGYYALGSDISFIQTVSEASKEEQNKYSFIGTLDGRYQTINCVEVSNNVLGMFGCSLQSKTIDGVKCSPLIKNLTINNVSGENRVFGETLNDLEAQRLSVSQGDKGATESGLLANNFGSNNNFKNCTFSFNDTVEDPCLFVDKKGENNTFTSTTIKYLLPNTRIVKNDETSGPSEKTSGVSWATIGDINLTTLGGIAINTIGSEPLEYLSIEDDPTTKNDEIAEWLFTRQTHSNFTTTGVEIKFSTSKSVNYPLTLKVAKEKEITNIVKTVEIKNSNTKKVTLYNLIPNQTYYYQIVDSSVEAKKSIVDSFSYASKVRGIYNTGCIRNMRDIGGWMTQSGNPIKYGLLYRSAIWSSLDEEGASILTDELGIKTEVDLRKDYTKREHTFTNIDFVANGLTDAYEYMFTDSGTITNIKKLFNNILSNEDSYPLCYHCSVGADRTGLCSLLIEGCLGVSDEDIYRDYELTTFYISNRVRADIEVDAEGNYYFRKDGGRSDFWHENGFKQLLETNLKSYYTDSGKVCDAIVNFLKTKCDITDDTISKVRNILIEN